MYTYGYKYLYTYILTYSYLYICACHLYAWTWIHYIYTGFLTLYTPLFSLDARTWKFGCANLNVNYKHPTQPNPQTRKRTSIHHHLMRSSARTCFANDKGDEWQMKTVRRSMRKIWKDRAKIAKNFQNSQEFYSYIWLDKLDLAAQPPDKWASSLEPVNLRT
jgi:hypothetical protein